LSMEIVYANNVIRRRCQRTTGKLKRRLDDIRAAESLGVLRTLPGHFHALSADRAGQWACDLDQPYRLVFRPVEPAVSSDQDSAERDRRITAVSSIEVVDYHER
jgi:toxin HigB-1